MSGMRLLRLNGNTKVLLIGLAAMVLILGGCANSPSTPDISIGTKFMYDRKSTARTAEIGTAYRFELLTHCGVERLWFDGRTWKIDTPLSQDMNNPPPGWPNPIALGSVTLLNQSELTFTFSEKPPVLFRMTSEAMPKGFCA